MPYTHDPPDWPDMPKPAHITTLYWVDIYAELYKQLGRAPSQAETSEVFNRMEAHMSSTAEDDYMETIQDTTVNLAIEYFRTVQYEARKLKQNEINQIKFCHACDDFSQTYWKFDTCLKSSTESPCHDPNCTHRSELITTELITTESLKKSVDIYEVCQDCNSILQFQEAEIR